VQHVKARETRADNHCVKIRHEPTSDDGYTAVSYIRLNQQPK
jgi:hypothetical protein